MLLLHGGGGGGGGGGVERVGVVGCSWRCDVVVYENIC